MTTTFDDAARVIALKVKAAGRGFLTIRRDELRDAFGIGRFTEGQSEATMEALGRLGVFVYPHLFVAGPTVRLYDQKHPIAGIAEAVYALTTRLGLRHSTSSSKRFWGGSRKAGRRCVMTVTLPSWPASWRARWGSALALLNNRPRSE